MNRRTLVSLLSLPAIAAALGGFMSVRSRTNPYYDGPPSDHFDGAHFFNPGRPWTKSTLDLVRWQLGSGKEPWPDAAPSPFRETPAAHLDGRRLRVVLIGHASVLLQAGGHNILIDPVFSERASPFAFAGPRRVNAPGIAFDDLPPIDTVLVTHNHYDHLDVDTLRRLAQRHAPRIVTPLGNDTIMRDAGVTGTIEAHDWGARVPLSDRVAINVVPIQHWSARGLFDRMRALWAAFVIETPAGPVYHVGDTGYGDGRVFRGIRERFGAPRLAVLPIGAYEPRWFMSDQHINPDEAVRIFKTVGARSAVGHHWGTFQLTDEGIGRPPEALAKALAAHGVAPERFRALRPGEAWEASAERA
jgi:L-ascorbate metabolism protein UlaG (beta-lactamase superfamily)